MLADLAAPASDRDAAALMAALDANGDGGVSMDEFMAGIRAAQAAEAAALEAAARERERAEEEGRRREAAARLQRLPAHPWQHPQN